MPEMFTDSVRNARARAMKITHLTDIALGQFTLVNLPDEDTRRLIEVIMVAVVHETGKQVTFCCPEFERSLDKLDE